MDIEKTDIKDIVKQCIYVALRRWMCILPFPFFAAFAIYYAASLPPVYMSQGVLLVENQNIPQDLIRTTITSFASQQMEVIRQQILSTENVLELINKHGLFASGDDVQEEVNVDRSGQVQRFRNSMSMEAIEADIQDNDGRRRIVSIAFRISFEYTNPEAAQRVADELVDLFLNGNIVTRNREAAQTAQFLRNEADELQQGVIRIEDQLADFKSQNADSLPELLEYNLSVIDNSERQRRENLVAIDNLTEQEQLLAIELRSIDPHTGLVANDLSSGAGLASSPRSLLSLKRVELANISTKYSESHPSVISLRREISLLESEIDKQEVQESGYSDDDSQFSPVYLELRYRLGSIERDIENLRQENVKLASQITEYKERVSNTYLVEREYEEITRELDANTRRYDQLRSAQHEAEVSQSLEESSQAESLKIIERPRVPSAPIGPERLKIMVVGVGFAGAISVGLALLLEILDERVRDVRGFRTAAGSSPMMSIPLMYTDQQASKRKKLKKILLSLMIVLIALVILAVIYQSYLLDFIKGFI